MKRQAVVVGQASVVGEPALVLLLWRRWPQRRGSYRTWSRGVVVPAIRGHSQNMMAFMPVHCWKVGITMARMAAGLRASARGGRASHAGSRRAHSCSVRWHHVHSVRSRHARAHAVLERTRASACLRASLCEGMICDHVAPITALSPPQDGARTRLRLPPPPPPPPPRARTYDMRVLCVVAPPPVRPLGQVFERLQLADLLGAERGVAHVLVLWTRQGREGTVGEGGNVGEPSVPAGGRALNVEPTYSTAVEPGD